MKTEIDELFRREQLVNALANYMGTRKNNKQLLDRACRHLLMLLLNQNAIPEKKRRAA